MNEAPSRPSMEPKDLYRTAFDSRNLEITLFWQRCNYFLVLNSALALGFFSLNVRAYAVLLALIGLATSILWFCVSLGSKFWQSRWEHRLGEIEKQVAPGANLFSADRVTVQKDVEESLKFNPHGWFQRGLDHLVLTKPSVTLMMMILSLLFTVAWLFGLILLFFTNRGGTLGV